MADPIITLTTDFGEASPYVAAMKGVILSINPQIQLVDISHDVPPQDIIEAAWLLRTAYRYFPAGTVHLVVVDPGVGSNRRAIAVRAFDSYFVAPDNGVLFWALRDASIDAVELTNRDYFRSEVSATFHGRDVFAPVAAHLAAGMPLEALGRAVLDPVRLDIPEPLVTPGQIRAHVAHIDRFGNLITSIDVSLLDAFAPDRRALAIQIAGHRITGIATTYSDASPGELLALIESTGLLEIAAREASAAALLQARRGAEVLIEKR